MAFDFEKVDKILNKGFVDRNKHLISSPETKLMVEIALPNTRQGKELENTTVEARSIKKSSHFG